jgi:hypothetical protein
MPIFKILGIFANHTNNIIKYNISLNNYSKLKKNLDSILFLYPIFKLLSLFID